MTQRKQSFRFRIPWPSVSPESFARRQKDSSKSPTQSDPIVPIQTRPSVITPAESPPTPTKTQQALPRNEPQNRSPPRITEPITPVPASSVPKMKSSPMKIIDKSPQTTSQPKATTLDEERSISTTSKPSLETPSKFLHHEEEEKAMHETKKLGKAKDTTSTSQPIQPTKASSSGTKDNNIKKKKKKQGVHETVERKIMFATSNSNGKDIGVVGNVSSSSSSPQKNVPSKEEKEKAPMQKGIKDDITKFVHKIAASVHPTQSMEDKQISVLTLLGENRGATMHVGSDSAKKEGSIHIHRAYKTDNHEESNEVTTDGERNNTSSDEEDSMEDSEVGKAYVNSNIQSINNSLIFHGSINERDPGVQVTLPQKPSEAIKTNDKDTQSNRTKFNINRSQKTTYQPMVQRRGVRGLHEPSESGPDKPRRHGCKLSCSKNIEDIEVL